MAVATTYFSNQARKAFARLEKRWATSRGATGKHLGGARSAGFPPAEKTSSNSSRPTLPTGDANIGAVAFTSALNPTLEALGYLALAIVTGGKAAGRCWAIVLCSDNRIVWLDHHFLGYVQRFNHADPTDSALWTNIQTRAGGSALRLAGLDPAIKDPRSTNHAAHPGNGGGSKNVIG